MNSLAEIDVEKYIIIKRWRLGLRRNIKIVGIFNTINGARKHCCKLTDRIYDEESLDEKFKMTFWDRTKKIIYDII